MYYKQKSNVIFRNYEAFGYITDNRNFGYGFANDSIKEIGEKIVSQSAAVFLSKLSRKPQTIECLAGKIKSEFYDVDIDTIIKDATEFYALLERDGFIASGETLQECNNNDVCFSYKTAKLIKNSQGCSKQENTKISSQDFLNNYFNDEPQLTNIHIEITSKCNERCLHCYIPHKNKISSIKAEMFYDIIKQCRDMNLLHITISGGEPMLHENFVDFLKKCNEYNFSVNVLSNLTLLNDDIVNEMKNNPLLSVQTSLYSINGDIHDSITQVSGSFEKTKQAVLKLVKNDIPLQISCPIMKQNLSSYKDVIMWGKQYNLNVGSDYVIIAKYNHSTNNLSSRLSVQDVQSIIEQKANNDPGYLESIKQEMERKRNDSPNDYVCSVCHSSICVTEKGIVYPCAGWQDYIVGNLNESSLKDIWMNSEKVKYLRNLRKKDFEKCRQCPEKDVCTMCMVRNANESQSGNPLEVNDYYCQITKCIKNTFTQNSCKN